MTTATSRREENLQTAEAPSTRQVVLGVAVSLDGYIARLDGRVDWLIDDPTIDLRAFAKSFDAVVAGRKTLDVDGSPDSAHGPMGELACYIFSKSKPPGKRGGAEYVNCSPGELISRLKQLPGKDIWLMGGGELAREFLREDLVDRMELGIMPVLLGEGIPLFPPGFARRNLRLVNYEVHPSGIVMASYARA